MFAIAVLRLVKEAQLQHGLRHDDYQRYRYVCNSFQITLFRNFLFFIDYLTIVLSVFVYLPTLPPVISKTQKVFSGFS